ncbi:phosphoribosylanthranilate isomerase [Oleiharenicola lentus]|uniref:N-(5'-phosphoribosyl)anthranilate isomerase n=1 Tax=Oleiharenicola lentus TaxID=2508720 RepID=A0A4Q1CBD1_9BACT|nr:phosphoribosylanthranilate isomerase [Oleiharenicola lentus]RXK56288.1 phosphoribosylanthranilate isomerase [Oleiharenicola lentus]
MINGVRLKVCGLTSLVDAEAADAIGADALGFIFYPKSPRGITLTQFAAMKDRLPPRKKVAVCVEPSAPELAALVGLGFDHYQIHFGTETPFPIMAGWSHLTGRNRLWLAPKLPPEQDVKPDWLPLADTFLLDTFHADKFGGTGETGDWAKFKRHRDTHPGKTWILSGGLKPDNVAAAVSATGAKFLDVNSGVELSPGVKDPARLKALVLALHHATKQDNPSYSA